MMKHFLIVLLVASGLLADYYSIKSPSLDTPGVLEYERGLIIEVKGDSIKLRGVSGIDWLIKGDKAETYDQLKIEVPVEPAVLPPMEGDGKPAKEGEAKTPKTTPAPAPVAHKRYNSCNLFYLLKKGMRDSTFALHARDRIYLVQKETSSDSIYHPVQGRNVDVSVHEYRFLRAVDDTPLEHSTMMRTYTDLMNNLIAVEFLGKGEQRIKKVTDERLQEFMKQKASLVTELTNMDMSKEKLYFTFSNMRQGTHRSLNVTYEMAKKNIKVVTKSPVSLFDPENKSSATEENVGFLRSVKGDLYELKKVQIVNGAVDVNWVNLPNKRAVKVDYITNGQKDSNAIGKSQGQQFYGIEGVLYLASWMHQNKIDKKVFSFINGAFPVDMTMLKTGNGRYELQKKGNVIYRFTVDRYSIVTNIHDPGYSSDIVLESKESDTTIKNKRYLNGLQKKYGIVLVKG
jgi:flagellar biosynthesis/type III secretory pathway chaperone